MMRLLLLLIGTLAVCYGFDPNSYAHSQQMLPRYKVFWNADEKSQMLYLALHVQTTGWVGFGIAEFTSGSMPGSDIVVGSVVDGSASVSDLWASEYALPNKDDCQDWILVAAEESDGFTTIELARPFDTKDEQDRAVVSGPNRVVVAFGENGVDNLGYHYANRITSEITFFGGSPVPPLPSGVQSLDFVLPNYTIPDGETNYVCLSMALPVDQEYSIIQIDPVVDPNNIAHVHHFLVYICENATGFVSHFHEPGNCFMADSGGCSDLLAAWAAGGGPTVLPENAGFAMGPGDHSAKYLVLQIHFNNPTGVGGYVDNSGVKIWYTNQLRQYEAGMVVTGDPSIFFPPIPANSITAYEAECPSVCTEGLGQDITIWQSFPHMHQVGSEIWTTQWRDGIMIGEFGRVEYWSFDHQQSQPVSIVVKPGDRLNTHCVYDTRGINNETTFGVASTNEMCMHFLSYYPRVYRPSGMTFSFCGYLGAEHTICGNWDNDDILNYTNPTIFDPPGGENRTFGISGPCEPEPTVHMRPLPTQPAIQASSDSSADPVTPGDRPTRGPKPTSSPAGSGAGHVAASVGVLALACVALFLL